MYHKSAVCSLSAFNNEQSAVRVIHQLATMNNQMFRSPKSKARQAHCSTLNSCD